MNEKKPLCNYNGMLEELHDGDVIANAGLAWKEITGSAKTMVPGEGYAANKTSLQTFTLPVSCAFGKIMRIAGVGTGLWKIAQNADQIIRYGANSSEPGTDGSLASSLQRDSVELLCILEDLEFQVISYVGSLIIGAVGICGLPVWDDAIQWNDTKQWKDS